MRQRAHLVPDQIHPQIGLSLLFPDTALPLAATWFSGIIRRWHGEGR
ncbi:hypothetical protein LO55_4927 [Massilia timonae]|uniref:Uncharacterized protein n=1 Tax=Massilia timonae TaxID=47229 RepID=A0A1S2N8S1_9BURK|nr:hypothetical protein LO55_4927 [Massilia timonae]